MTTEVQKIHKSEITLNDVQDKIIAIQGKNVLWDSDVAWLYARKFAHWYANHKTKNW